MNAPALLAGLKMASARLRAPRTVITFVVALAATLLVASLERAASPVGAADRSLASVFRFVVPLSAVVLSGLATGPINLRESAWAASRFGHTRGGVAVGIVLASVAASVALSLLVALVAVIASRAGADAGRAALSLLSDILTTSWIAVLAGSAYASWLGLAATFGARGGGRVAFLVVDFVLGGAGVAGVVLPRGGITHLIGGEAPFGLPQAASSLVVPLCAVICVALGSFRCRD